MSLADSYQGLTIAKDGELVVRAAKRDLQTKRVFISKVLKADRDKAIKYQKDNIAKEKELIGIIAVAEKALDDEIEKQAQADEMTKRRETLDIRREELKRIGLDKEYDEAFLLSMSFEDFMNFIRTEKARLYEEEQEKKANAEAEEKRKVDLKEAEERGRLQAEAKAKADAEKKEQDRLNAEAKEKSAKEAKELQDKMDKEAEEKKKQEQQERLEKTTKYKKRLKDNGHTEDNKQEYSIQKQEGKVVLRKFISEFKI